MTRKVLLRGGRMSFWMSDSPPAEPHFTFADPSPKGGRIMPNIIGDERR